MLAIFSLKLDLEPIKNMLLEEIANLSEVSHQQEYPYRFISLLKYSRGFGRATYNYLVPRSTDFLENVPSKNQSIMSTIFCVQLFISFYVPSGTLSSFLSLSLPYYSSLPYSSSLPISILLYLGIPWSPCCVLLYLTLSYPPSISYCLPWSFLASSYVFLSPLLFSS